MPNNNNVLRRLCPALACLIVVWLGACSSGSTARVIDSKAGLSYDLPSGWAEKPSEDLLDFFTSASGIRTDSNGNGAILSLGSMEGLFAGEEPELAQMAEGLAADFSEFFVPFEGRYNKAEDKAIKVGNRDAHRVVLEIDPDETQAATVEAVVVDLESGPAFALGVVMPQDPNLQKAVSRALESLEVVE